MEGNQVGNRLVPDANLGTTFNVANSATNSALNSTAFQNAINNPLANFDNAYLNLTDPGAGDTLAGRLAAERARRAKLEQEQRLAQLTAHSNPRSTAAALTWDTVPVEPQPEDPNPIPDEGLVWPHHLIEEIANARKPKNVQLRLARALFFLGSLGAIAVSLVQLILIAAFQDYDWVHSTYFPLAIKITCGVFILLDLLLIPRLLKTLKNLRETTNNPFTNVQPYSAKVRHRTIIYAAGLLLLNLVIWLTAVVVEIPPHVLTILLGIIILLTPFFSLCVQKNVLSPRLSPTILQLFYVLLMVLSGLQALLNFVAFYEEPPEEVDYAAIERLVQAQAAARISSIPANLSDLVFAICQNQPYSTIYYDSKNPNTGLFECNASHEVYAVAGPGIVADGIDMITANAFYFGVTSDTLISRYFPPASGAKYLFRDFRSVAETDPENAIPSELVLLVPATDSEALVTTNLGSIANLLREHGGSELRFSLFYNESLDTVLTTRDFILIAAADTITLTNWLPHGHSYNSVIGNQPGRYVFNLDHDIDVEQDLAAFTALGSDPALYSSQTRDAINSNPHITTLFTGIPNSTTLRTQLLEGIIDPLKPAE